MNRGVSSWTQCSCVLILPPGIFLRGGFLLVCMACDRSIILKNHYKDGKMHELSLMQSVTELVKESALQNNIHKISKVKLVVGKFSMALPDSLQFAFAAIAAVEPLLEAAVLEIELRSVICRCLECNIRTEIDENYSFICSNCASVSLEIIQGRELYLDYYEGE